MHLSHYNTLGKSTTALLEETFALFGYIHNVATENESLFTLGECQKWCKDRGIVHFTEAPYHPATYGADERLVQTFKQELEVSSIPYKSSMQEFYCNIGAHHGYSPSKLLTGRQIRTKIYLLLPSRAHAAQGRQLKETPHPSKF